VFVARPMTLMMSVELIAWSHVQAGRQKMLPDSVPTALGVVAEFESRTYSRLDIVDAPRLLTQVIASTKSVCVPLPLSPVKVQAVASDMVHVSPSSVELVVRFTVTVDPANAERTSESDGFRLTMSALSCDEVATKRTLLTRHHRQRMQGSCIDRSGAQVTTLKHPKGQLCRAYALKKVSQVILSSGADDDEVTSVFSGFYPRPSCHRLKTFDIATHTNHKRQAGRLAVICQSENPANCGGFHRGGQIFVNQTY
jgi:hypothetical protein